MTGPVTGSTGIGLGATGATPERDRLRQAAHEFEAVLVTQLFKEMRATIPAEDAVPGQEMFTGLLDEALASEMARRSTHGVGEALYRQLAARLGGPDLPANGSGNGNGSR